MEGAKKKDFDNSVNVKIQRKFDLVFGSVSEKKVSRTAALDNSTDDLVFDGDSSMNDSAKKEKSSPKIDLNFDSDDGLEFGTGESEITSAPAAKSEGTGRLAIVPDDNDGLEFNLDFGDDSSDIPAVPAKAAPAASHAPAQVKEQTKSDSHFELDLSSDGDIAEHEIETRPSTQPAASSHVEMQTGGLEMDNLFDAEIENAAAQVEIKRGTQPTIVYDKSAIDIEMNNFDADIEMTGSTNSSADLMTTEEAKANIESTIKDIIRPKPMTADSTQELDLGNFEADFSAAEDPVEKTPSVGFAVQPPAESTGEFDLSSVEFADKDEDEVEVAEVKPVKVETKQNVHTPVSKMTEPHVDRSHTSFVSDEESTRFHATIRQMREEREILLNEIKTLKGETRELEQDNLTLKAALDEAKIEISIVRKRHMVEMEDLKYRLAVNEEKRAISDERAKSAEARKEKLEQRVRIDFNQVKQREKELETKLEMLSIDVDSQVQTRDQKILELRRKIDSLEFNMENVSIREQKSQDDKRKLEDKLNKIMKTLRHSIKNLEDDIDQVTDEAQDGIDDNDKSGHRSKT
jgi:hypothetical protein